MNYRLISEYQRTVHDYEDARNKINNIISNLSSTNNCLSNVKKNVGDKYMVNNSSTPIIKELEKLRSDISDTISYQRNTILPAIESEINRINENIRKLQEQDQYNKG